MAIKFNFYELCCLLISITLVVRAWTPDITPKLINPKTEKLPVFFGNTTDYFKILDQDDNTILIGARNNIYNLSSTDLRERERIEWISSDADRELCALKGKTEQDCQNYIRVFARLDDKRIMICGTNSYKPRCRTYTNFHGAAQDDRTFEESEAQGRCAYNPTHNSTYVFTDGQLYSATVADFSSADPLIYREPQRTEQYDLKQLNQPDFVSAMEMNGYVLFFFREIAMEYMNCGKAIYSRIARVCKNDKGGPYGFADRWTSFLKARLNCSMPGEYPFYFDEIQATSKIIESLYQDRRSSIIYAVFTTSINAIPGSAVCAFSTDDIVEAFEGPFKVQKNSTSVWLPLSVDNLPEPRPGRCVDDSRTLPSSVASFIKTHSLMENAVPAMYGRPLFTSVSFKYRLTAVTVDPQVITKDGSAFDVAFVGTDDGRVIKFVNVPPTNHSPEASNDVETVVISEIQILDNMPVRELTVAGNLIVVGDGYIKAIPLHHCSQIVTCIECIDIQDPYCAWNIQNHECGPLPSITNPRTLDDFIQNITSPEHGRRECEKNGDSGNRIDQRYSVSQPARGTLSAVAQRPLNYPMVKSREPGNDGNLLENTITHHLVNDANDLQLANTSLNWFWLIALPLMVTFLAIGIVIGRLLTKRACKNSPFAEHRNELTSSRPLNSRTSGKDTNLLMNVGPRNNKRDNLENEFVVGDKDRSHECKNSTENLEKVVHCKTTGTLTKVKSTYI